MSEINEKHLKLRVAMNKKRPKFKRENYFRLKRIQTSWRSPKGIDSKMRHRLKGKRKSVATGYRGPKSVRGLHPLGKEIVIVSNIKELEAINKDTQIAQIKGAVGSRKRNLMINFADDEDIHIINPQIKTLDFDEEDDVSFIEVDDEDDLELVDDDEDLELIDDEVDEE